MCKATRYISGCGAVLFAVVGLSACGGGGSGDVVARVAGYPITKAALAHWMSVRFAGNDRTKPGVLGFLISSQWTIGEAAELGVKVTDGEAQKQLERFKYVQLYRLGYERFPKEAELQRLLASRGETFSDQLWLMKLNMLATRIEQKHFSEIRRQITHAQIAGYYGENRQRFFLPEGRDVEVIMTYNEAVAKKAKREVQSGKSFLSVVKRVSVYPDDPGGLPRWPKEKAFHKHVFAAKPHVLTGPVNQALDYYVFEVTKITPAGRRTLAQSEASIGQRLAVRRQQQVSTKLLEASEQKWTARTSCRPGYVVLKCRQYMGTTGSPSIPASAGMVVSTKRVKMGMVLGAGAKMLTVYLFEADKGSTSACYGACARIWRPVTTIGAPTVGGEAIPADLGTITRSDGTKQVTYFHHPLYYYAKDRVSGDVYGQGVKSFGSDWFALRRIGVKFERSWGE